MTNSIEIILKVKDYCVNTNRLDAWITEAIKVSDAPKQELNNNNLSMSRSRVKKLI